MTLPKDAKAPSLSKFSLSDLPYYDYRCQWRMDEVAFYDLMDKKIALYFPVLWCCANKYYSGQEREIQVNLDVLKMQATDFQFHRCSK
jgi:HAE1 family hydrophobic/amphiphilic exporter-1